MFRGQILLIYARILRIVHTHSKLFIFRFCVSVCDQIYILHTYIYIHSAHFVYSIFFFLQKRFTTTRCQSAVIHIKFAYTHFKLTENKCSHTHTHTQIDCSCARFVGFFLQSVMLRFVCVLICVLTESNRNNNNNN